MFHKLKKFKSLASEVALNSLAFTLFISSQQFVSFPIIAKIEGAEFGNILTIFALLNVVSSLFGNGLGVNRLVKKEEYIVTFIGDFSLLIICFAIISLIIGFLSSTFVFNYSIFNSLLISLTFFLATIRTYTVYIYRLNNQVKGILAFSVLYAVIVIVLSILMRKGLNIHWIQIFLLAEVMVLLYNLKASKLKSEKLKISANFTKLFKDTLFMSFNLGFSYMVNLSDRIILNPITNSTSVAIYYSSSVISKVGSLVLNPLSGIFLSKLSGKKISDINKINSVALKFSVVLIVLYTLFLVLLSPFVLNYLYPQYYNEAMDLVVFSAISASFSAACNVLKQIMMKFYSAKKNSLITFVYGSVFLICCSTFAVLFGLKGFAISSMIINILYYFYIALLLNKLRQNSINTSQQ